MRNWKFLLVNGNLFANQEKKDNQLILTFVKQYSTHKHIEKIITNFKYFYSTSSDFREIFLKPKRINNKIVLELKSEYNHLLTKDAFKKLTKIIQEKMPKKTSIRSQESASEKDKNAVMEQPEQIEKISKQTIDDIRKAFAEGKLFKSIKISGQTVHFQIEERFDSRANYPFITQELNAHRSTLKLLTYISYAINPIPFDANPTLTLKKNHRMNAKDILNLLIPSTASHQSVAETTTPIVTSILESEMTTAIPVAATTIVTTDELGDFAGIIEPDELNRLNDYSRPSYSDPFCTMLNELFGSPKSDLDEWYNDRSTLLFQYPNDLPLTSNPLSTNALTPKSDNSRKSVISLFDDAQEEIFTPSSDTTKNRI